ncbi:MAG: hypothetical protein NVS3B14_20030 [Ktedonobacteraceae bacterium]
MDYTHYEPELFAKLQPLGDASRIAAARNDKKSQLEFLAIKIPVMQRVVQEGFSFYSRPPEEILAIWDAIWFSSRWYEEMSAPLIYYELKIPKLSPALWPTLSRWSDRIENWAHSDGLAHIYSYLLAQNFEEVYRVFQIWNNTESHWLRRLSIVSLIHYSGKKAVLLPLDKVLPMLENCPDDERPYVQKAIGRVLRETNYVYHHEISGFIEQHLADLRGIAFSAAVKRFSAEECHALIERRKAMRVQSKIRANRLSVGKEN